MTGEKNVSLIKIVIIPAIVGAIVGSIFTLILGSKTEKLTKEEFIKEFYEVENAVHVSPHSLRKQMDKGDINFVLVDLRSNQEYIKEHIIGAVNIPAYSDPDTSAYQEVERIINQFKSLPKDKDVIVYCYSTPCMTGRKIGKMLADNGIYVKHLGIGWNEWRYNWTTWNHEGEWDKTKVEDYIWTGDEPGTSKIYNLPSPCGDGEFGC